MADGELPEPIPAGDGWGTANEPKRHKKDARRLAEAARALDPWERYRALVDTLEEASDLIELADRKARFALVIMGALNIVFFFLSTRAEVVQYMPVWIRPILGFYLVAYSAVALFFFLEAIEALKPRSFRPNLPYPGAEGLDHHPDGLRYYEDVVQRDVEAYRRAWREVRFGQLNAELAVQNHILARINVDKYRSLRRLYGGLRVLTIMAGGLLVVLAMSMLLYHPSSGLGALSVPSKGGHRAGAVVGQVNPSLGEPQAVPFAGVREMSGVAWSPARGRKGRLFVVSDRGSLAEIEPSGAVVAVHQVRGNLEDVTEHEPSGRLVLLAEQEREIVIWDPASASETGRFGLDVAGILGREPTDRNRGFEGIVFRAEAGRPGGGVFHLVHQGPPARLVTLTFDPAGPSRVLGWADVLASHAVQRYQGLTAVTWSEQVARLLVIAEGDDRLLVLSKTGALEAEMALPGGQQEGLALDSQGALWVADERIGLVRFDRAAQTIRAALPAATEGAGL